MISPNKFAIGVLIGLININAIQAGSCPFGYDKPAPTDSQATATEETGESQDSRRMLRTDQWASELFPCPSGISKTPDDF